MDLTGQTLLGKYELTALLGKGGMGEVWEGEHTLTGRRVAVKILSDKYLSNKKVVARFGREARAASAVHHEGIVEILDQDVTPEGVPFLVMEYLEGESVGQRIKRCGRLSEDEALAITVPLLDALHVAHEAGIIHRDLKPDNVFILPGVRGDERVKILDFGISQKADEIEHHLTQEGSVLGTPHYMSPEQARGDANIDARVDVYAVGVMLYECVVGTVPFDAKNYNALLQTILMTPPPSPRSHGAEISPATEQLILAAMDKRREKRPPSAQSFRELLLEAGMQEDDALLDIHVWAFVTPSAPPPSIAFELEDVPDEPSVRPEPGPLLASHAEAELGPDLEADLFSEKLPEPPTRSPMGRPSPEPRPAPPRPVEAGPDRGVSAGRAVRPEPVPQRDLGARPGQGGSLLRTDPQLAPVAAPAASPRSLRGAGPAPVPQPGQPVPLRARSSTRPGASAGNGARAAPRRPADRPRPAPSAESQVAPHSVWLRGIFNWLLVLAALLALGYLANMVFKRPDPRKSRRAREQTAEAARGQAGQPEARGGP